MAKGYSLHIGVEQIDQTFMAIDPATGCDKAADDMAELAERLGYEVQGVLKSDQATLEAVKPTVIATIGKLQQNDIFLLTLAGHGMQRDDSDCEEKNQAFILHNHKWIDDDIYDLLKSITVKARVIVVADACHSGSIFAMSRELTQARKDQIWRTAEAAHGSINFIRGTTLSLNLPELNPDHVFACHPPVTANILLLAASSENAGTRPGPRERALAPPFTQTLLESVDDSTDYPNLRDRIRTVVRGAVLNTKLLRPDGQNFKEEKPFKI